MKSYSIPTDMNEKEKIIGGVLNINQFFWVLGGFVLGLAAFGFLYPVMGGSSILIGIIIAPTGLPFVIIKKEGLTLFQYIKRTIEFNRKSKFLPNKRS